MMHYNELDEENLLDNLHNYNFIQDNSYSFTLNYNYPYENIFLDGLNSLNKEDNNSIQENKTFHYYSENNSNKKKNIFFSDRGTDFKTISKQKNINFSPKNKIKGANKGNLFSFWSIEDIRKIFSNNKEDFSEIEKKFFKNPFMENFENKLLNKKRRRYNNNKEKEFNKFKEGEKFKNKKGRKGNNNNEKEEHTKQSSDNIIKKIKGKLFYYLVIFLNNLLNKKKEDKEKIYNISYKYINKLKKDNELELLEKSLKELLSMDVTSKKKKLIKMLIKN